MSEISEGRKFLISLSEEDIRLLKEALVDHSILWRNMSYFDTHNKEFSLVLFSKQKEERLAHVEKLMKRLVT